MILVDDNDNSIENHQIRNQHYFDCKQSSYCFFHIEIAPTVTSTNGEGDIVNYRIIGYIPHNHTKEALGANKAESEKSNTVKMEEDLAELRNELIKAKDSPETRKSEYYNQIKNIRDKINRLEKKSLHVDDEPILPEDILMTDEYLNTICYHEDHLKSYVKAMRFLPVKVKIVRVLWYLKNGKAEFRRSLKINKDNYIPFSIPLITGENVTCKVNLRSFYEASDIEKVLKKMFMIYEGKEPIDKIDFDIVDNGMEEEVENENENTMAANEDEDEDKDEDKDDIDDEDKDKDDIDDEDYETPEATKERKKKVERRKKHYNSSVNYFKETKSMRYL